MTLLLDSYQEVSIDWLTVATKQSEWAKSNVAHQGSWDEVRDELITLTNWT